MKSCLGILLVFFTFVAVVGGGAFLYYISSTSTFTRTSGSEKSVPKAVLVAPKAIPVAPKAVLVAPKAVPVR
jgi:hypothetical protein